MGKHQDKSRGFDIKSPWPSVDSSAYRWHVVSKPSLLCTVLGASLGCQKNVPVKIFIWKQHKGSVKSTAGLLTVWPHLSTATRTWKISLSVWMMQDSWLHEVVWALPPGSEPSQTGRSTWETPEYYRNPMEEVVPTEKAWGKLLQDLGSSSLTGKRAWLSSIIYSIYFQV